MNKWTAICLSVTALVIGAMMIVPFIVERNTPNPSVECVKAGGQWVDTNPSFVVNMGCRK